MQPPSNPFVARSSDLGEGEAVTQPQENCKAGPKSRHGYNLRGHTSGSGIRPSWPKIPLTCCPSHNLASAPFVGQHCQAGTPFWRAGIALSSPCAWLYRATSLFLTSWPGVPWSSQLWPGFCPAASSTLPNPPGSFDSLLGGWSAHSSFGPGPSVVAPASVPGCLLFRPAVPVRSPSQRLSAVACRTQLAATPRTFPAANPSRPANFKRAGCPPLCSLAPVLLGCGPSPGSGLSLVVELLVLVVGRLVCPWPTYGLVSSGRRHPPVGLCPVGQPPCG